MLNELQDDVLIPNLWVEKNTDHWFLFVNECLDAGFRPGNDLQGLRGLDGVLM